MIDDSLSPRGIPTITGGSRRNTGDPADNDNSYPGLLSAQLLNALKPGEHRQRPRAVPHIKQAARTPPSPPLPAAFLREDRRAICVLRAAAFSLGLTRPENSIKGDLKPRLSPRKWERTTERIPRLSPARYQRARARVRGRRTKRVMIIATSRVVRKREMVFATFRAGI